MKRFALIAVLALSGCCWGDLQTTYIEADRATYDVVSPRFRAYVEADKTLDDDKRDDLLGLDHSWGVRLKTAEQALKEKEEAEDE